MTSTNDLPARGEARPDAGRIGRHTNSSVLSDDAAEARLQILANCGT